MKKKTILVILICMAELLAFSACVSSETQVTEPEGEIEEELNVESEEDHAFTEAKGSYILPDSDKRYYTESELNEFSADQLRLARNEIYAKRGRIFEAEDLREYFESQSWYIGTIEPDDFSYDIFNEYEKANIEMIKRLEDNSGAVFEPDQICTFIPVEESCSYDLDGDGVVESISVVQEYFDDFDGQHYPEDMRINVIIDGRDCASIEYAGLIDAYCILNIDSIDGTLQIGVQYLYTNGGDGYLTAIFSYDNGELLELGTICGTFSSGYDETYPSNSCSGDGTIESYKPLDVFQTWFASATWMLRNGELVELVPATYEPLDLFEGWGIDLTVCRSITLAKDNPYGYEYITLPAGAKVHMTGTDNKSWVCMTVEGYDGDLYLSLYGDNGVEVFAEDPYEKVYVVEVFDNLSMFN